jgi:NADPH:quinone reductase-like Zn-dependent oxidoreductase
MRALAPFDVSVPSAAPRWIERPDPIPAEGEVLIEVRATALNRADLLQLRGLYPPPPGESDVPGLEASGEILALGPDTSGAAPGDRVAALLAGGGHAERVCVPVGQTLPLWPGATFAEAAAVPEAAITSWLNLVVEGELVARQTVLVTGANGGIGSFALQLARALGARPIAVVRRSAQREAALRALGAVEVIEARAGWGARFAAELGGGADLALDLVGGGSTGECLRALRAGGRCVLLGVLGGATAPIDLADLLRRRLLLKGSTLRGRSRAEKAELVAGFEAFAASRWQTGELRPVVDRVMAFAELPAAYAEMAAGVELGKIVATR